jgi:hypothetical protein
MGARFYDAALGRWILADTIVPEPGNPQDLNRFSYVGGNPLRFVDPTGHMEEGECGFNGEACSGEPPDIEEIVLEILQGMVGSISDPARTDPIIISLDDGTNLVIMPVGSDPFQDRSGYEWLGGASEVIGILGAVNDAVEGLSLLIGGRFGPSDFFAGTDTILAMACSASSGDMWFGKPHPDLPAMWLGGQDVLWTAGVDGVGPHLVGGLAAMFTGSPEGYVAGKWGADLATTGLSIGYDVGRVQGAIPTVINRGWSWSSGGGLQGYILVYPEHLLSP